MQVKKQLQNSLELERDNSLSGENAQKALVNDELTVSFVDDSVDQFFSIDRTEAVPAEPVGICATADLSHEDVKPHVENHGYLFEDASGNTTNVAVKRLIDVAVAIGADPDQFVSVTCWRMFRPDAPVLFEVPAEGWVAIAPLLPDEVFETPIDSLDGL